jgi:hypothetical protein
MAMASKAPCLKKVRAIHELPLLFLSMAVAACVGTKLKPKKIMAALRAAIIFLGLSNRSLEQLVNFLS